MLTSPDNSYTGGTTIVGNSTVLVASDAGLGDAAGGVTLGTPAAAARWVS